MAYNGDLTWLNVSNRGGSVARQLIDSLNRALNEYEEWQSFRAGRTNAQIATALSRTETEVAELDSCFAAGLALFNYADNATPTQSDYFFSLRKFSS